MTAIRPIDEGVVWKDPSRCGTGGQKLVAAKGRSLVLPDGSVLHAMQVGQSRSSPDCRCMLTCSRDRGRTWEEPWPAVLPNGEEHVPSTAWLSRAPDGAVRAVFNCSVHVAPDDPRWREDNGGWIGTWSYRSESNDGGRTWGAAEPVVTPSPVGGFSVVSSPVYELDDGRQMVVTEPMFTSALEDLHHEAAVVFSHDGGRTWTDKVIMAADPQRRLVYFDPRLTRLPDERWLALYWTHNRQTDQSLQTTIAWSDDAREWSEPQPTPLWGFLTLPLMLPDGRLLAVFNHRREPQGVCCCLSADAGRTWEVDSSTMLWDRQQRRATFADLRESRHRQWQGSALTEMFTSFDFGTPDPRLLDDASVLVTFYAADEEECIHERYVRFQIQ